MRNAVQLLCITFAFIFCSSGSASGTVTNEVVTPYRFSSAIVSSLEFLLRDEIYHLGSRRGQRISLSELLQKLKSNEIQFVTLPYIAKPDSANRFSAFSDPVSRTIFINAHDPLMRKLLRPIALHEFFMNVGIEDSEYQLSLLVDAYINVSNEIGFAFMIEPVVAEEKRKLLKTLLLNAMNQYVRHTGGARPVVSMVEANNKLHLPDGGSSVGNGGDNNDIFFKREILNDFMFRFMRNSTTLNTDTTAFMIDLVSLRVRLNFVEQSEPRFFVSRSTNMLNLIYTSVTPQKYDKALRFAKDYTHRQWMTKNGIFTTPSEQETILKKLRYPDAFVKCQKFDPKAGVLDNEKKPSLPEVILGKKMPTLPNFSLLESSSQLKEVCGVTE